MTPTTTDQLADIESRWAAVPAGPWESTYRYRLLHSHDWLLTCLAGRQLLFAAQIILHDNQWAAPDGAVQVAIAAAPDDIAVLLAEVQRLRHALADAERQP